MDVHIWPFVGIAMLVIIAPGPDTVLVTKNAVLHGRGAALGTSLGVNTGLMIWTLAAAFGVAALVRQSEVAFTILKLVGAVYLVYLGAQALRASRRHAAGEPIAVVDLSRRGGALLGFRQGVVSNLANPKIAVFFTSLLPQFVSSREPVLLPFLLLGSVFVLMTLIWLCSYALLASRISDVLTRPPVRTALDRLTGVVLIGLGIRLALERR
jgi:RhtB (resistance to homoserine/threonine) family protein